MENVCDICGQSFAGLMFSGRNEEDEREDRRICFFCIAKRAGFSYAEAEHEVNAALSPIWSIDRVDEDGVELPM